MDFEHYAKEVAAGLAILFMIAFGAGYALLPLAFIWWLIK